MKRKVPEAPVLPQEESVRKTVRILNGLSVFIQGLQVLVVVVPFGVIIYIICTLPHHN